MADAWVLMLLCFLAALPGTAAAGPLVPNPSFDTGEGSPESWVLTGRGGAWETRGRQGPRCVSVTGSGREEDSSAWRSEGFRPEPGTHYRLSFWTRAEGTGGAAVAGLDVANRDFPLAAEWTRRSFVFRVPEGRPDAFLRLGQWCVRGTVLFDDLSLTPAIPVHRRRRSLSLGAGEQVKAGRYRFEAPLSGEGSNSSRPLHRHTAGFNSNRWILGPGNEVVYRHQVGSLSQSEAEVSVQVGYHVAGRCLVSASRDGKQWTDLGALEGVGAKTLKVPDSLLPARALWVRLRGEPASGDGRADLQVYGYAYSAALSGSPPDAVGETHFVEVTRETPGVRVEVADLGGLRPAAGTAVALRVSGLGGPATARVSVTEPGARARVTSAPLRGSSAATARVPYALSRAGEGTMRLAVLQGRQPVWEAQVAYHVSTLHAADYGYPLPARGAVDLWWCEGTYKVSRDRPAPSASAGEAGAPRPVTLEAARGEYEPVQVVLRPRKPLRGLTAQVTDLVSSRGRIPASEAQVCRVAYVPVSSPTDSHGEAGDWPDPLPPLRGPIDLPAGLNQPLWITLHVPDRAPAGRYRGDLVLKAEGWSHRVPLELRVWDFALPPTPRLVSAFGFSPSLLREYHHLETDEELKRVHDLYLRDFARHRISPYNPMALAPIGVKVEGDQVVLDFRAFDEAASRYLDGLGFTTFSLPIEGMGGGTFYSRTKGSFGGHEQGTPEYDRLMGQYLRGLQDHLEEKGWLSKAYIYWFDEPEEKDYEFVAEGMSLLKRHAPKLARMLTKHPSQELQEVVDIWCPILNDFDPAAAQAQKQLGRKLWWYVCTGPKAPYLTLFIDHPAVNLRTWSWLSYKHGVDGLLVWETHYWTSPTAFPPPAMQDPYQDPMSYVVGYGVPPGTRAHWGNGDGRFIYPPEGHADGKKRIEGPVSSLRWEMLREGVEDVDTLWVLRESLERAERRGAPAALLEQARELLKVPEAVVRSATDYSVDPKPIYRHRRAVAAMIERLSRAEAKR